MYGFDVSSSLISDLLDDEDFEHHNGIIGLAADFGRMEGGKDLFKRLPVDEFINAREDIFWKILVDEVFSYGELFAVFLEHY